MKWPRFDPSRGYRLCEPCWNGQHWNAKVSNCREDGCQCGCIHGKPGPRPKPDKSRQMVIDTGDDVIRFGSEHKDEN